MKTPLEGYFCPCKSLYSIRIYESTEKLILGNVLIIFIYLFIFLFDWGEHSKLIFLYRCIMLPKGTLKTEYVAFFVFKVYFD